MLWQRRLINDCYYDPQAVNNKYVEDNSLGYVQGFSEDIHLGGGGGWWKPICR